MMTEHMDDNGAFELTEDLDRARAIATGERAKYLQDGFSETVAEQAAMQAAEMAKSQFLMERQRALFEKADEWVRIGRKPRAQRIADWLIAVVFILGTLGAIVTQQWASVVVWVVIGIAMLLMSKPHWFRPESASRPCADLGSAG